MSTTKPLRLLVSAAFLSASALAVSAQTTPSSPSSPPADKPPMAKPETTTPQTAPKPSTPTAPKSTTAKETHPMVGRTALTSDGNNAGSVRAVKTGPDGKVVAIQLKVGGFLGFGGKIVEVADGKFTQKGETIQLAMSSEELDKLPEVKDAS